ncbi:Apolipoprotein D [Chionoecetes opilio]|uniref:Apolipoprotein D n=1 Tax=Chionoecetes opilio TaxID=41210 RepID=A0A8J5CRK1_CHIOP|nr:Apolipoprotein D [Chionoecetes opilio]
MMRRMSMMAVVAAAVLASVAHAQVFYKGRCPKTKIIENFDFDQYLGRWYEQERYFVAYEAIGLCWSGTYIKNYESGKVSVRLDFRDVLLKRPKKITVNIIRKRPVEEPNRLTYTIPGVPLIEDNYEVLATDYIHWTLEYTCLNKLPFGHTRIAWILTRERDPEVWVIEKAKATLAGLGIDAGLLKKQVNTCFVNV